MPIPTRLAIDGLSVRAYGRLDLLEARLVHILGSLDPTPHGARVAEHAALAVVEHSDSCVLLHDGPGIPGAPHDALTLSAPDRAVVIARRGVTPWHETLASSGALVLEDHQPPAHPPTRRSSSAGALPFHSRIAACPVRSDRRHQAQRAPGAADVRSSPSSTSGRGASTTRAAALQYKIAD